MFVQKMVSEILEKTNIKLKRTTFLITRNYGENVLSVKKT